MYYVLRMTITLNVYTKGTYVRKGAPKTVTNVGWGDDESLPLTSSFIKPYIVRNV